jgi:hypothetical protein
MALYFLRYTEIFKHQSCCLEPRVPDSVVSHTRILEYFYLCSTCNRMVYSWQDPVDTEKCFCSPQNTNLDSLKCIAFNPVDWDAHAGMDLIVRIKVET